MTGEIDPYQQREFRCHHCNGRIVIPVDLPPTTGPCPHCGGVITSPSFLPTPPAAPAPPPPAAIQSPAPGPAPVPEAPAPPRVASVTVPLKAPKNSLLPSLLVMLILVLGAGAGAVYLINNMQSNPGPPTRSAAPIYSEEEFLRTGWQREAYSVLQGYMQATTAEGKSTFILGGKDKVPAMNDFYGGGRIVDSDTPAAGFSVYELSMEDRKRGLFMMVYDQPPQVDMKEYFRPLATLEVQFGMENADLLLASVAQPSNFAMEPMRVQAFFKRTPQGLKLDWDTFAQTKYRTFRNFIEIPSTGKTGIFRVFVAEDVPLEGKTINGVRTYLIADPANTTDDWARLNVKVDSEAGRALSVINWRGTKDAKPITRTATVELEWVGTDDPQLAIRRFICWEFLGLGGQQGAEAPPSH